MSISPILSRQVRYLVRRDRDDVGARFLGHRARDTDLADLADIIPQGARNLVLRDRDFVDVGFRARNPDLLDLVVGVPPGVRYLVHRDRDEVPPSARVLVV